MSTNTENLVNMGPILAEIFSVICRFRHLINKVQLLPS